MVFAKGYARPSKMLALEQLGSMVSKKEAYDVWL